MSLDLSTLTKGQTRKLNALRKSLGNEIADDAFAKWMKTQTKEETIQVGSVLSNQSLTDRDPAAAHTRARWPRPAHRSLSVRIHPTTPSRGGSAVRAGQGHAPWA